MKSLKKRTKLSNPNVLWKEHRSSILNCLSTFFFNKANVKPLGYVLFGLWHVKKTSSGSYVARHSLSGCYSNQSLSKKWPGTPVDDMLFDNVWGGISGNDDFINDCIELVHIPSSSGVNVALHDLTPSHWAIFCRCFLYEILSSSSELVVMPYFGVFRKQIAIRSTESSEDEKVQNCYLTWVLIETLKSD